MTATPSLSAPDARRHCGLTAALVAALWLPVAVHAQVAPGSGPRTTPSGVLEFRSDVVPGTVLARPDTDRFELSDGRTLKVGDVRRLTAAAQRLRASASKPLPAALARKPAAKGVPVRSAADLATALERSDDETLQLPSGRRLTVGMLRLLQPEIESRIGRSLSAIAGAAASRGKATRVGPTTDWAEILAMPDDALLEAPDGTRITVADLKRALAAAPARTGSARKREGR